MLILQRREGERVVLQFPEGLAPGAEIVVTSYDLTNSTVRLAIDAPKDAKVLREEVLKRIESEAA